MIIKRKPSISETKEENNNYTVTDMDAQSSDISNNSVTIHTHSENGNISEHHFHTIVRPNGCVSMQPVGRVMQKKYLSPPRDPFNNQYTTGKKIMTFFWVFLGPSLLGHIWPRSTLQEIQSESGPNMSRAM